MRLNGFRAFTALGGVAILLADTQGADFEANVLPIFEEKCFGCHSDRLSKPKAGIRYDSAASLALVGKEVGWDRVLEVVQLPANDLDHMPPREKVEPLTPEEVGRLRGWIEDGQLVGDWTHVVHSKRPITSGLGESRVSSETAIAASRIDDLVRRVQQRNNVSPAKPLSDDAFVRKAYLEVVGRNPSLDEVKMFRGHADRSRLLDELLDSTGYVSRNFNYWADVLRVRTQQNGNAEGVWVKYLKESIRENKPYDQWVTELLTAEGRLWDDPAIAFRLRDGNNRLAGYEAMSSVFMGTDIGCAQCHDHPTEPLTQLDYYKMWGYLVGHHHYGGREEMYENLGYNEVRDAVKERNEANRMKRLGHGTRERDVWLLAYLSGKKLQNFVTAKTDAQMSRVPSVYRYEDVAVKSFLPPGPVFGETPPLVRSEKPNEVFAEWLVSRDNLKFTHVIANRLWTRLNGRSLLGKVTDTQWADECDTPALAEYLGELMVACEYDLKQFQRILLNTSFWQSESISDEDSPEARGLAGPVLKRLSAEQIWDSMMTLIHPNPDSTVETPEPDFEFYHRLAAAESMEDYWSIIEVEVDRIRESEGRSLSAMMTAKSGNSASGRKVKSQGFSQDELVRASEIRSPAPAGHFLRVFGQGDRELIEDRWKNPTVPQLLMLLNGGLFEIITASDSLVSEKLEAATTDSEKVTTVYLMILGRTPSTEERSVAETALESGHTISEVAWALLNSTEFLFLP